MYPGRMIVSGGSSENLRLLHEGKVQCSVLIRNNMGLDKKDAPALCFAGCMCAIMIAAVAFCIVFPGVVEWIGIYAGLVFFVLVGMGIGAAVAVAAGQTLFSAGSGKKDNINATGDDKAGDSGSSGREKSPRIACGCVGMLLGGVLSPAMPPLAALILAISMFRDKFKSGEPPHKLALGFFLGLLFVGGITTACVFGAGEIGIRLCVINTDDTCVSGEYNGTMALPSGMYLHPPSIWVINQKPVRTSPTVSAIASPPPHRQRTHTPSHKHVLTKPSSFSSLYLDLRHLPCRRAHGRGLGKHLVWRGLA